MKSHKLVLLIGLVYIFSNFGSVFAATILDTGFDPDVSTSSGYDGQASKFTIGQSYSVSSIETHVVRSPVATEDTLGTMAIYADDAGLPGAELFSQQFKTVNLPSESRWQGLTGLSWVLAPGTYWTSIEVRPGDTFDIRGMSVAVNPAEDNKLLLFDVGWIYSSANQSWRIEGTLVPVPAAAWLFGSGLLGLIGIARRKKAA